jgi:hypothetical protein
MADKNFALPLNSASKQDGDITFKELTENDEEVKFRLINITTGNTNALNLKTKKNGTTTDHVFAVEVSNEAAYVTLTPTQMQTIYAAASGGDVDFIQATWTLGAVDTPDESTMYELQGDRIYNRNGWPPKTS